MKATLIVATIMLAVGTAAHTQEIAPAQDPAAAQNPAPAASLPSVATPAAPAPGQAAVSAAPGLRPAPDPRRRDIAMMEGVLTKALQQGAQDLAQQLKVREPNSAFVTGTGRARGFILEGYGVFFDVDVPGMRQSVIWSAQMLELEQQRQATRQFLASHGPDHPMRKMAEMNLRQIERLMGTAPGAVLVPSEIANTQLEVAPGRVTASTIADAAAGSAVSSGLAAAPPPAAPLQQVQQLRDPNELYTDSVKNALIEAMLRYSGFLKIADNEWLTVAASDSDGPGPGQIDDASRIVIRVKGADLAAFQANKLTREEVMKRVEVKEF